MLSPGKWHELVPRDMESNLRYRVWLRKACKTDAGLRKAIMAVCEQDVLFWINSFVWQHNPRKKKYDAEVGPFITWDFQDEAVKVILWHIAEDEDLLIEKSREMGASWLCLLVMDWLALFHHNKKFLCVSHSEDAVDRPDDPDSLFWKVQFVHENLPAWMGQPRKRKMGFAYKRTRSAVNGAATTVRSGVGGRATAVFLDEFSKQRDDHAILGHTADTGCRIFNGTHYGVGTAFFGLTQRPDLHKLQLHWSQHPDKRKGLYRYNPSLGRVEVLDHGYAFPADYHFVMDGTPTGGPFPGLRSPWYDRECRRRANSRDVAMHLDIDPRGSAEQFFDPLKIRVLQETHCCSPFWEGDVVYDPDTGKPIRLERRDGGPLKLWLHLRPEDGRPQPDFFTGGADTATGTGATPSCLSLVRVKTGEKVGEYTNSRIEPKEFAKVAFALCWLFKDPDGQGAFFAWEMQGPGETFGLALTDLGYRNVYYRRDEFVLHPQQSAKPGWYPAPNNKDFLLREYRSALEDGQFINRSKSALAECLDFRYNSRGNVEHGGQQTGDLSGSRVNHGDHVIADALAWKMAKNRQSRPADDVDPKTPPGSLLWRREYRDGARKEEEAWA